ncbi:transaldolase, partial [Candidatus Magnetomorum sp. HK-1]
PILCLQCLQIDSNYWEKIINGIVIRDKKMKIESLFWETYKYMIKRSSDLFLPLYEETKYRSGFVSAQLDIRTSNNVQQMVEQGIELSSLNPNIMIKVPITKHGIEAVKILTSKGISTNCTLVFVLSQIINCAKVIDEGLNIAYQNDVDLSKWRSVISYMTSRFGELGNLRKESKKKGIKIDEGDVRMSEIAILKKAYKIIKARGFKSKLLACSLKTGPTVNGQKQFWHLEHLGNADMIITCPPMIFEQLLFQNFDIDLRANIEDEIPSVVMDKLIQIEYFNKAYSEEGYNYETYNKILPLKKTLKEHSIATNEMINMFNTYLCSKI